MTGAVVHHQVDLQLGRDPLVDALQETNEVGGRVRRGILGGEHLPRGHVERSEQGVEHPVTHVLRLPPGPLARHRRAARTGRGASRDVLLLVHRQHQGVIGRVQIQPAHLRSALQNSGLSVRVIHERTRCGLMSKSARIRPICDAEISIPSLGQALRQLSVRPMAGRIGRHRGRRGHDLDPLVMAIHPRPTRPLLILQTGQAPLDETSPPHPHELLTDPNPLGDLAARHPLRRQQDDPGPLGGALGTRDEPAPDAPTPLAVSASAPPRSHSTSSPHSTRRSGTIKPHASY